MNLATYLIPALGPHKHAMATVSAIASLLAATASLLWYFVKGSSFPPFIIPYLLLDLFLETKRDMIFHHIITLCLFAPLLFLNVDFAQIPTFMKAFLLMEVSTVFLNLVWLSTNGVVLIPKYVEYGLMGLFILAFFKFRVYDFTKFIFEPSTFQIALEQLGSTQKVLAYFIPLFSIGGLNLHWAVKILKKLGRMMGLLPSRRRTDTVLATTGVGFAAAPSKEKKNLQLRTEEEPETPSVPAGVAAAPPSNPGTPRPNTPVTEEGTS